MGEVKDNTLEFIKEFSGEDISKCYQCGKCSAGCPSSKNMNILPNVIIRRLQLGQQDSIWKCSSCMTCWSRCPREVNLCNIIEALRFISVMRNGDKYRVEDISENVSEDAPQQAIISLFRKFTR
ncbi:4Fe-4S dicluster domain-containing protein [bacterium]